MPTFSARLFPKVFKLVWNGHTDEVLSTNKMLHPPTPVHALGDDRSIFLLYVWFIPLSIHFFFLSFFFLSSKLSKTGSNHTVFFSLPAILICAEEPWHETNILHTIDICVCLAYIDVACNTARCNFALQDLHNMLPNSLKIVCSTPLHDVDFSCNHLHCNQFSFGI